jgi:hypothetical protein
MTSEQQVETVTRGLLGINVLTVLTTYGLARGSSIPRALQDPNGSERL